jgi:hypothetical protein
LYCQQAHLFPTWTPPIFRAERTSSYNKGQGINFNVNYQRNFFDDEIMALKCDKQLLLCQDKQPLLPVVIRIKSVHGAATNMQVLIGNTQIPCPVFPFWKVKQVPRLAVKAIVHIKAEVEKTNPFQHSLYIIFLYDLGTSQSFSVLPPPHLLIDFFWLRFHAEARPHVLIHSLPNKLFAIDGCCSIHKPSIEEEVVVGVKSMCKNAGLMVHFFFISINHP